VFQRFAALGDSFTEGLSDQRSDGTFCGWADMVALRLAQDNPELDYINLAVRGKKLRQVATEQVPVAVDWNPDLISIGAGANDIIRLSTDVATLGRLAHATLGRLADSGARVVVFSGFDPRIRIPLTQRSGARAEQFNESIRRSARYFDATLVDLWDLPRLYEDSMWAPDKLHLTPAGHALIADAVLAALGIRSDTVPPANTTMADPDRWEDARWFVRDVIPWMYRGMIGRSSGDGMDPKYPYPVRPAKWSSASETQDV
jgi:lysophospholipase L1-like esterase